MSVLSRAVQTCKRVNIMKMHMLISTDIYILGALSSSLFSPVDLIQTTTSRSAHALCKAHSSLGGNHNIQSPLNSSYPYKAWCENIFQQSYFHRQQAGSCYSTTSGDNGLPWTDIDLEHLLKMIKSKRIQLFDVRQPEEITETGMMPGATNIPLNEIPEAFDAHPDVFKHRYGIEKPNKDDLDIVFSCLGGVRSRRALIFVHDAGFTKARHYIGGWEEYSEKSQR